MMGRKDETMREGEEKDDEQMRERNDDSKKGGERRGRKGEIEREDERMGGQGVERIEFSTLLHTSLLLLSLPHCYTQNSFSLSLLSELFLSLLSELFRHQREDKIELKEKK